MKYRKLGKTDLEVSLFGLGTMTWGDQNTEAEAHEQIDYAFSQGVTFLDAAEMYPVPPKAETQGRTEQYIGNWFKKTGRRSDIVLATKIAGPARQGHQPRHIRNGETRHDLRNLELALEESLKRLQTDYIDLYQLHWPDRSTNTFGRRSYPWIENEETVPILETLEALSKLIKSGKVRHIGVSNETPWGVSQFIKYSENLGLPLIASIQNPYNLLNRQYETGLSEFAHWEKIGLLAYSPFAFGVLSGKYLNGARPPGARLTLNPRFGRYNSAEATQAVTAYVNLARKYDLPPSHLALAFVHSRPFVHSTLSGASTLDQLKENITSINLELSEEILNAIEEIHTRLPNPSP